MDLLEHGQDWPLHKGSPLPVRTETNRTARPAAICDRLWSAVAVLMVLAGWVVSGPVLHAQAKHLYLPSCNDVVERDGSTGAQIAVYSLAVRTPLVPAESPRTAFCHVGNMGYDASTHSALVEITTRDGVPLRTLRFRLPGFQFAGIAATQPPARQHAPAAQIPGLDTSGPHKGWLDLATYGAHLPAACTALGQGKQAVTLPVRWIGRADLVTIACTDGARLATIDPDRRQLHVLDLPVSFQPPMRSPPIGDTCSLSHPARACSETATGPRCSTCKPVRLCRHGGTRACRPAVLWRSVQTVTFCWTGSGAVTPSRHPHPLCRLPRRAASSQTTRVQTLG